MVLVAKQGQMYEKWPKSPPLFNVHFRTSVSFDWNVFCMCWGAPKALQDTFALPGKHLLCLQLKMNMSGPKVLAVLTAMTVGGFGGQEHGPPWPMHLPQICSHGMPLNQPLTSEIGQGSVLLLLL